MFHESPVGMLEINARDGFIYEILFAKEKEREKSLPSADALSPKDLAALEKCTRQFDEYFEGKRKEFDFPFKQAGTPFQNRVWEQLTRIPYGKTISYRQLSLKVGNEKAIRAVGTANGCNHLNIVVPCHRVIGANGSLTGYGGGLWRKQWLLEHENKYANGVNLLW